MPQLSVAMKLFHPSFTPRSLTKATALGALALVSSASAALLLDYTDGIVLASASEGPSDKNDGAIPLAGYLTAPFFGGSLPTANVSLNGHIYFGAGDGVGDYSPVPFNSPDFDAADITRISPMWTDMSIGSASQVLLSADSGSSYTAVTWVNMEGIDGNEGFSATFQAIYFNSSFTLNGISFNAGDIAFSYGDITGYDIPIDIMIGLDEGVGAFATLPGYEMLEGWAASYEDGMPFPVGADEYVLFRANGSDNYDVSLEAIPEPSATAAALLGGLLLIGRRRR